jgi:hypothetical protein
VTISREKKISNPAPHYCDITARIDRENPEKINTVKGMPQRRQNGDKRDDRLSDNMIGYSWMGDLTI